MNFETLTILFDCQLKLEEVPMFRAAVMTLITAETQQETSTPPSYRYGYPVVQYKEIDGKAAVVCINEAIDQMNVLLSLDKRWLRVGNRQLQLHVEKVLPFGVDMSTTRQLRAYHLKRWLPFSDENYNQFYHMRTWEERTYLLERILVGNLLSMAKGLGVFFSSEVLCPITYISPAAPYRVKNVGYEGRDIDFMCNVQLPPYISLGRYATNGFGLLEGGEVVEELPPLEESAPSQPYLSPEAPLAPPTEEAQEP